MQSVQMIAGELNTGDIELMSKDDSALNKKRKNLILKIKKKEVCHLTLPMVNHFEELKNDSFFKENIEGFDTSALGKNNVKVVGILDKGFKDALLKNI